MMKKIRTWGGSASEIVNEISAINDISDLTIAHGNNLNYGDCAHAPTIFKTNKLQRIIHFNTESGILLAEGGVTIAEILQSALPKGWTLPVVPGHPKVTLGGAIAADIHGKNHLQVSSISRHIIELELYTGKEYLKVSPKTQPDLFQTTCSGMGMTGFITKAKLQLKSCPTPTIIKKSTHHTNIDKLIDHLQKSQAHFKYGWIHPIKWDQCLLVEGDFAITSEKRNTKPGRPLNFPVISLWSQYSIHLASNIFFHVNKNKKRKIPAFSFYFPTMQFSFYNRLAGPKRLSQIHFLVRKDRFRNLLRRILTFLKEEKQLMLLITIKEFGASDANTLSFCEPGLGAAIDLKNTAQTPQVVAQIYDMILADQGRIYLPKDAVLNEKQFKSFYPRWEEIKRVRLKYNINERFQSNMSKRLGLA